MHWQMSFSINKQQKEKRKNNTKLSPRQQAKKHLKLPNPQSSEPLAHTAAVIKMAASRIIEAEQKLRPGWRPIII